MAEGIVMSVDVLHHACEVKVINSGTRLNNVQWLLPSGGASRTGSHMTPTVGDKVVVSYSLSYAYIIGFLPIVETMSCNPVQIDSGAPVGDTGNLSTMQDSDSRVSPGRPEDMALGDHVWTSEGGGLMGLLRGGTVLLRASRLAQIIISKFDDLVRIVGRNYEVFTDAFLDASYNLKGRIYRFTGYAESHSKVREDDYTYKEYKGDVALAEYAEGNGFVDSTYNGIYPAAGNTVRKVKIIQGGNVVYDQVLDLNGHKKDTNYNGGTSYIDQTGTQIQIEVINGSTSVATLNGSTIVLDQGSGASTITLSNGSITLVHGSSSVTLDGSSVVGSFAGGGSVTLNGSQARLSFGSHYINVNSGGIQTV